MRPDLDHREAPGAERLTKGEITIHVGGDAARNRIALGGAVRERLRGKAARVKAAAGRRLCRADVKGWGTGDRSVELGEGGRPDRRLDREDERRSRRERAGSRARTSSIIRGNFQDRVVQTLELVE